MTVSKRLDDTDGESAEFNLTDNAAIIGKFVITGTANAVIKIFEERQERGKHLIYKAVCADWNSASVALHIKTTDEDDDFSDSGIASFSANGSAITEIR